MFTARAASRVIAISETIDSVANSTFIRNVSGIASAGAKLVPLANAV
jgi:hypothetical protein